MPKIHLESTKDVAFLKQQFKQTIRVILSTLDASMQEIALANNTSLEQVQQEAAAKLDKWLEHLFQLAGNGIEINGLDYKDAMDNKQQYMQFEENLRINVDEMYNQANQQLVQVSRVRKQAPLDCNMLVKDSLSILDTFSTEAIVTDDSQVENKNNITDTDSGIQKPLSQNDYETCLTLARQLQTVLVN